MQRWKSASSLALGRRSTEDGESLSSLSCPKGHASSASLSSLHTAEGSCRSRQRANTPTAPASFLTVACVLKTDRLLHHRQQVIRPPKAALGSVRINHPILPCLDGNQQQQRGRHRPIKAWAAAGELRSLLGEEASLSRWGPLFEVSGRLVRVHVQSAEENRPPYETS